MKTKWKVVSPYTGMEEDAPANFAGGGNIAGLGVDHPDRPGSGEPGFDPKKKKKWAHQVLVGREGKIDGRTKGYREHRKKLEQARQKREITKKGRISKFIETIKKRTAEMTAPTYVAGLYGVRPMASLNAPTTQKKKKKK